VFADLTAKLVRDGDGDDFVAIGGQVALDSEHGWMLADVLPLCFTSMAVRPKPRPCGIF
jgi:hypothetical protein